MSTTCTECDMEFSRKDVMLRHKRNKHGISHAYPPSSQAYPPSSQAYPPPPTPPPPPPPPPPEHVVLQHPFTLMAIGPTSSGKSCWMNRLLTRAQIMIEPPPERIIWCYKRWQPLFSEMQSRINNIVFVQGIPEQLNDDSFIDTRYPSLIVIDDLMRDAVNSKDVCELFVEGSHHRNISVACILQNGFSKGKENRTMSINTQYIVLFKNPRDQVGPAILARQMYPSNSKKFMNKYIEATKRPYGYLFIDLKQSTPEEDRLKTDIFDNSLERESLRCQPYKSSNLIGGSINEYINRDTSEVGQFEDGYRSEQTYLRDVEKDNTNTEEKMPSCDDCGLMFENIPDLARHMNRWCPENNDLKRKRDDDEDDNIPSKKSRLEEQTIIDEGEDVAFTKFAELAREASEDKWESKVDKYVNDGLTEEEARLKADLKLKVEDLDQLMSKYGIFLRYELQLRGGKLHSKVMKLVEELVDDGMDYTKAIKIAIRKYKHMLENYIDEVIEDDSDDEEENDDDDDDNDDDDEEDD